jgi:hypothetical protein
MNPRRIKEFVFARGEMGAFEWEERHGVAFLEGKRTVRIGRFWRSV